MDEIEIYLCNSFFSSLKGVPPYCSQVSGVFKNFWKKEISEQILSAVRALQRHFRLHPLVQRDARTARCSTEPVSTTQPVLYLLTHTLTPSCGRLSHLTTPRARQTSDSPR